MSAYTSLSDRFCLLLERHIQGLRVHGARATGCAPCHADRHPSFSADLEKGVWYCHTCGKGGGVKDFALLVGEPWAIASLSRPERRRVAVSIHRREAAQQAHGIRQRREEERREDLFDDWRRVNRDVAFATELLALFYRRPDLEAEFFDLAAMTERDYSEAVSQRVLLEAKLDGEVAA